MKDLVKKYPTDNDAKALYAYALFQANDWDFWALTGKINPVTSLVIKVLNKVFQSNPNHIAANHY